MENLQVIRNYLKYSNINIRKEFILNLVKDLKFENYLEFFELFSKIDNLTKEDKNDLDDNMLVRF